MKLKSPTQSLLCNSFGSYAEILFSWSTHWFHVEVTIPKEWVGQEVRFCWDSGGEAMIWIQGEPQQVINPRHACAARVTVVVLCVCVCVCVSVCLLPL